MAVSDFFEALPGIAGNLATSVLAGQANRDAGRRTSAALAPNIYDQQYQQLATQLQGLTGQLADTNNPQFQSRVRARMDEIMRQYEAHLRQQQAVEARRYGRTGMGMVNPERRDEAIARSLAAFRSQAEAQARAEAMKEMVAAAQETRGAALQVAGPGTQIERSRAGAAATVANQTDANRKANYLQLAGSVLGPLLKGVDFKKLGEGVFGGGPQASGAISMAPQGGPGQMAVPTFDASMFNFPTMGNDPSGMFDPGYGYAGGGAPQGGMDFPSFDMGDFPAAGADPGGMFDPGYGYAAPQFDFDFPSFGSDPSGTFDPGYGYAAPQFDPAAFSFDPGTFDFGADFGYEGWF